MLEKKKGRIDDDWHIRSCWSYIDDGYLDSLWFIVKILFITVFQPKNDDNNISTNAIKLTRSTSLYTAYTLRGNIFS
jgi:hypothetical protein